MSSRPFLHEPRQFSAVQRLTVGLVAVGFALLQACSLTPIRDAPAPIVGAGEAEGTTPAAAPPPTPAAPTAPATPVSPVPPASSAAIEPEAAPAGFQEAPAGQIARLPPTVGRLTPIQYSELPGWSEDSLQEAWPAWLRNCQAMARKGEPFVSLCRDSLQVSASDPGAVRRFFEERFVPHRLSEAMPASAKSVDSAGPQQLITGYYEPIVRGARSPGGPYQTPLYRAPPDLITVSLGHQYPELRNLRLRGRIVKTPQGDQLMPYPSRAEIDRGGLLKGLEIAWLEDPIEAFFLQVQGSGKVVLDNGQVMRLGYANQNGHPYKSIGRWLVEQGELTLAQASMQGIKNWVAANPQRRQELLHQNPSVVFFRELPASQDPTEGPLGSLGVPLTAGRSLAVDPRYVALGLPVFLRTEIPVRDATSGTYRPRPVARLMMAQDTGSAITGIHRGDFYFGSGTEAGESAGRMRYRGEMAVLLPRGLQ
jgi:membrane-bound lytic murein transglycosylase A